MQRPRRVLERAHEHRPGVVLERLRHDVHAADADDGVARVDAEAERLLVLRDVGDDGAVVRARERDAEVALVEGAVQLVARQRAAGREPRREAEPRGRVVRLGRRTRRRLAGRRPRAKSGFKVLDGPHREVHRVRGAGALRRERERAARVDGERPRGGLVHEAEAAEELEPAAPAVGRGLEGARADVEAEGVGGAQRAPAEGRP